MIAAALVVLSALIIWRLILVSEALDNLSREVAENNSVIDSAISLLGNLAQLIREAAFDPAQVNALAASLDEKAAALAQAIAAATPFAPATPAPPPEPTPNPAPEPVVEPEPVADDTDRKKR